MQEFTIGLRILKHGWLIILITLILSVGLTIWMITQTSPTYQTDLRMFITADLTKLQGNDLIYGYSSLDNASIVTTFVELTNSRRIREIAAGKLNQPVEYFDHYITSAVDLPNSSVLEVIVTGPNPMIVQLFANALAESAVDFMSTNYSGYKLEVLDSAFLPTIPIKPNKVQSLVISLILGTMLGILIAIIADLLPSPIATIRNWTSLDRSTLTLKRSYFEQHFNINNWLSPGNMNTNLALIQLTSLQYGEKTLSSFRFRRLLKEIVKIIKEETRRKDVIVRWNDNSFIVLMPGVNRDQATGTLEQIRHRLSTIDVEIEGMATEQLKPVIGSLIVTEKIPYPSVVRRLEAALAKANSNNAKMVIYLPDLTIQDEIPSR
jgi:capsular polysaccharide biosynthesis protein